MPDELIEKVAEAYSADAMKRVCEAKEDTFGRAYGMTKYQMPGLSHDDDYFFYKDNGSDIIAVAHLDTVSPHEERWFNYIETANGPLVYCRSLDDRLGAYIILELLPMLGLDFDLLLTVGEEKGRSTAQYFKPTKEYNWMIEFDRGGTDVVMYQYDDTETAALVRKCGARVGHGSFSDIAYMEDLEIKGFNWGTGYSDYHGRKAHVWLDDTFKMVAQFLKFHEQNAEEYLPHEKKPWSRWGRSSSRSSGSSSGWSGRSYDGYAWDPESRTWNRTGSPAGGGDSAKDPDPESAPSGDVQADIDAILDEYNERMARTNGTGISAADEALAKSYDPDVTWFSGGTKCEGCHKPGAVDISTGWCAECDLCNDCWERNYNCTCKACRSHVEWLRAEMEKVEDEPDEPDTPLALDPPQPMPMLEQKKDTDVVTEGSVTPLFSHPVGQSD